MIGIAISSYNRNEMLTETLAHIIDHAPFGAKIIVVDDGSTVPVTVPEGVQLYRHNLNQGIAATKNRCLELLSDTNTDEWFLFDSDTFPTADGWWRPYVESPEPHLQYQFVTGPDQWLLTAVGGDEQHTAYDRSRGCMMYVNRRAVEAVGGMHLAWGKHGGEHGDWSERIHKAGLTRWPFADVKKPQIHALDEFNKGISSVNVAEHQQWRTVDAASLPLYAPFKKRIPVLMPRRSDNGWRDKLWAHIRTNFWDKHSDYEIIEGHHNEGPFNRSKAINTAANLAGSDWEVAIIADSDAWAPIEQIRKAVEIAKQTGRLVTAYSEMRDIDEWWTVNRFLVAPSMLDNPGEPSLQRIHLPEPNGLTCQSRMIVIPRNVWDILGGFDELFQGWGGEDNAFWKAATIATGEPFRVPGVVWHLWHETGHPPVDDPNWNANVNRWMRYSTCTSLEQIKALLAEGR